MTYINQSLKVLRHADRVAELQAGRIPFPINLEVDISNRCHLGCGDCHMAYTHSKGPLATPPDGTEPTGDLMSLRTFNGFTEEARVCGVKSITFTGGGDPLTHPLCNQFLMEAVDVGMRLGIYTAAIGKEKDLQAIRNYCDWCVVSVDCPDRDSYEKWKGVNAFSEMYKNVRTLTADGSDCVVGASFLLHEGNVSRIREMYDLHKQLGTDYCLFRPLVKYDLKQPSRMVEDPNPWISEVLEFLLQQDWPDAEWTAKKFARYADWSRSYQECWAASLSGVITPDCRVWACVNRRGFPGSCLGDLSKESFKEVWQRQRRWNDFDQCRVLCRGDEVNLALQPIMTKQPHEEFI